FHLFTDEQKQRLFANIAEDIRDVPEQIQRRQIGLFLKVDPAYGKGVADALGLKLD
ncbi:MULTISPECIES: catalase-related domain-containing protein, partial [Gammaproteobacteria]